MKYKVVKKNGWWSAYVWDENRDGWDWIINSSALTKIGCKYLVKKYHKKLKKTLKVRLKNLSLNKRFVLYGGMAK